MKYFIKAIFSDILTCVLCLLTSVQAATLPETAKIIPPETILLVNIDNFSQFRQQFEKINLYKLYKDPLMASFIDDFKTKCREKIQEMDENNIFKTFYNADVLPQGRVAFALVFSEQTKDANEPPILLISQWGENIEKIKDAIKKMVEKNIEKGGHQKRSEDYQGVSIETSIDEKSSVLNYCFIDDCFVAATNLDVLKFVVAHIKGATSPTLSGDSDYTATMKTIGPYHDMDLYVNIKQIIKMALAEDTNSQTQAIIANLGLDNVISAGYSLGPGRGPDNCSSGKAFLKINGPKKGICKMLEAESTVFDTPRFAPQSTSLVTFFNLNMSKAYNELANILNSFSPQAAAVMYMPLLPPSPDGQPGVNLKTDIIDHLGSQIVITQSVDKPLSANSTPETIVALAVNNRGALEKSMSLLHSKIIAPDKPDARRELLGHTIYLIDPSAMLPFFSPGQRTPMQTPDSRDVPQAPKLAFTVTDTHLIFASESTVERVIRTISSSASASTSPPKWFNEAKSAIPSVVGLAYMEDTSVSLELRWSMMKQGRKSTNPAISMGLNPFSMVTQMGFNFGLLPDFEVVRKYFGLFTSYGISTPEGFFFELKDIHAGGASN